jgi:tRNA pseudouridine65 synthase
MDLQIIFQDEHMIAINKPPGLLVHRTKLANDANIFALQTLRNQIQQHVYPIHRLDRKTSGVLLFGLSEDIHKTMQKAFAEKKIEKTYLAIVRGFTNDEGIIDYPLRKDNGAMQEAVTKYQTRSKTEIDLPFGKHQTSRYSLLKVQPLTGRKHQIRRHLSHIHHPIIADRPWGDNKQNKLFKEKFNLMKMMLHASELTFKHPVSKETIKIKAGLHSEFRRMLEALQLTTSASVV